MPRPYRSGTDARRARVAWTSVEGVEIRAMTPDRGGLLAAGALGLICAVILGSWMPIVDLPFGDDWEGGALVRSIP